MTNQPDISTLIKGLKDEDRYARIAAVEALRERGDTLAVPGLIEALADRDSGVRWIAAGALGQICDPAAVPALLKAMLAEDSILREIAAQSLGRIGQPALAGLRDMLEHRDKQVRLAVVRILGEIREPGTTPDLADALQDDDWQVRWAAVTALRGIGTPEAMAIARNRKRQS